MRVFVLCGGKGTRLDEYSYPKPLNMIHGVPSITYCLKYLPPDISTIYFIVAPHLRDFNFEEIVINQFKTKHCKFLYIPYFTRGPIESAVLGVTHIEETGEPIVFLDNDVIYNFPPNFFETKETAFLGYAKDTTQSDAYSFLTLSGDNVTLFKEKKRISDNFCCGVYGFKHITQFRECAQTILMRADHTEFYMSKLFEYMLEQNVPVRGILFDGAIYHIGSLAELQSCWPHIEKKNMTICFDLDNTLVTYPSVPGDYTTVKPITRMIELVRRLKEEGHTVIIHTARRMATHKNNVEAVIRDIGDLTIQSLKDLDIPYDQLIFGKPLADAYVDDRAVNPYRDTIGVQGYIQYQESEQPINMIPTNKYNTIEIKKNRIVKRGPAEFLSGEIYFYESMTTNTQISHYFPMFYGATKGPGALWSLTIENIPSIPLYKLYLHQMLTEHHIRDIFDCMDTIHTIPAELVSREDMIANYTDKLRKRFQNTGDYPFEDAAEIQRICLEGLTTYIPQGVGYIHGDLWFSNILVDFKNRLKFIDMKGRVNGHYTTGGDRLYDYCKLYQSFLGYDAILYGDIIPEEYRSRMEDIYITELHQRQIDIEDVKRITFSLIIGTFHAIQEYETKVRVWAWMKNVFVL
jgi:capsule biosynthesis phosphatase